jgi:hypothetical protein
MAKRKTTSSGLASPVAFIADIHLANHQQHGGQADQQGLNRRGRITIETLERAIARTVQLGCGNLIVGGDLFHHRRPEPAIIRACQEVLARYATQISITIIPGNHDMLDQTCLHGHTACQVVADQARVVRGWTDLRVGPFLTPLGTNPDSDPIAVVRCIPFESTKPMAQWIDEVSANLRAFGRVRAICTHVGVVDDQSPAWLRDARDAISADRLFDLMDRENVACCLVGNYHQAQRWERAGRVIQQVGVLNPTGWGDGGLDQVGGLAIWDGVDVRWEQVAGSRFVHVKRGQSLPVVPDDCSVFVRLEETGPGGAVQIQQDLYAAVELVEPDQTVVQQQDADRQGPPAVNADQALAEWVGRQDLVEPAVALDLIRSIWREAA